MKTLEEINKEIDGLNLKNKMFYSYLIYEKQTQLAMDRLNNVVSKMKNTVNGDAWELAYFVSKDLLDYQKAMAEYNMWKTLFTVFKGYVEKYDLANDQDVDSGRVKDLARI